MPKHPVYSYNPFTFYLLESCKFMEHYGKHAHLKVRWAIVHGVCLKMLHRDFHSNINPWLPFLARISNKLPVLSSTTRMHSSRMCTVRNSSRLLLGGIHTPGSRFLPRAGSPPPPRSRHPGSRHPWEQAHPLLQGMLGCHLQCMLG